LHAIAQLLNGVDSPAMGTCKRQRDRAAPATLEEYDVCSHHAKVSVKDAEQRKAADACPTVDLSSVALATNKPLVAAGHCAAAGDDLRNLLKSLPSQEPANKWQRGELVWGKVRLSFYKCRH
jgi:hypothetical protein